MSSIFNTNMNKSFITLIEAETGKTSVELQRLLGWARSLYSYHKLGKRRASLDTVEGAFNKLKLSQAQRKKILAQLLD